MYLVSGATGHVGSEVVRQLTAQGVRVRAMVHHLEKARMIADLWAQRDNEGGERIGASR